MSARLIHFFDFYFCWWIRRVSHWRECVSASMEIGKKRKSVWRRRIYRKYVSWNRLQKTQDEIYADVVLSRSRCSPGQWFPETDYLCASAIFVVGTSGIPPKLNYRSVKSYRVFIQLRVVFWLSSLVCRIVSLSFVFLFLLLFVILCHHLLLF